ncbi:MAG: hypothetical protein IKV32_04810 [Muribaculaceae bacterium]|nr:hypothetical protein [Muribaculaceae bacterium]
MKIFNLCFIVCIAISSCNPQKEHTIQEEKYVGDDSSKNEFVITLPEEMDGAGAFNHSKKWEDYRPDFKPYNVLDMTNKSVSEINKLYGKPIFNETDTICFGKIRYSSTYSYHYEPDIAFMFRKTPKIPLYQMWWKMNRDNITYILVLYCIDKDGDKYPVYGYAYDETKPLPE